MVLGVQWLRTLRKCEIDWECQEWRFKHEGRWVSLQGERELHNQTSTLQSLFPIQATTETVLQSWFNSQSVVPETASVVPYQLEEVLKMFTDVFATLSGLPPIRGYEHQIILK